MIEMINCAADSVKSVIKGAQLGVSDAVIGCTCDRDREEDLCLWQMMSGAVHICGFGTED